MHSPLTLLGAALLSIMFLQGTPAPPAVVATVTQLTALGGMTAGVITFGVFMVEGKEESRKKDEEIRRKAENDRLREEAKKKQEEEMHKESVKENVKSHVDDIKKSGGTRRQIWSARYAKRMADKISAKLDGRGEPKAGPGPAPSGVPQHNWDDCFEKANSSPILLTGSASDRQIRLTGVPPACMVLATWLGGNANGTAMPVPCGNDCMDYVNMSAEYYAGIISMLQKKAGSGKKRSDRRMLRPDDAQE